MHFYSFIYHQKCEADGCDSVEQEILYRALCFGCYDEDHPRLCHHCAFRKPKCLTHGSARVNMNYKETDDIMIAWP